MFPGSAYDVGANLVMMPRYGVSSTTTKLKVTASGLEAGKEYLLPVTIDKVTGTVPPRCRISSPLPRT